MKYAIRQAMRSRCRHKVGAAIVTGNRLLSASPNIPRNAPTVDYLNATFHAEEAVLRRIQRARGTVIYVARLNAHNIPALAKPCERCQTALQSAGVVRAYYTSSPTEIALLDVSRIGLR
ncbi:hypothetical protein [Streptomyces sp. NPDC048508]|uniref:hypothetical protein n=1 Tax=Streptomyces sp. NPDC048508 TaxID=3365561 RepID=UPI003712EC43